MRSALLFISLLTLARLIYLAFFCPYTLIEDEAQYWVWAQNLDWSYYTKGPGVAWVIWLSTTLLGDAEWAVRTPAVLAGALGAWSVARLTLDLTNRPSYALWSAVAYSVMPAYLALSFLMTIDGPLMACWAFATLAAYRGLVRGSKAWTLALGLTIGVGVLFKYTILLLPLGLLVWIVLRPRWTGRPPLHAPTLLLALALAALSMLPVLLWNADKGWPTVKHLLGHVHLAGGDTQAKPTNAAGIRYNPLWTLTYIVTQVAMLGPLILIGVAAVVRELRTRDPRTFPAGSLLIACSAPVFLFYLLVSFLTEPEGNWAIAAGVPLIPLVVMRAMHALERPREGSRSWTRFLWFASLALGVLITVGALRLDLLARLTPLNVIPAGRFTNADILAQDAQRYLDRLRAETGQEPFVIAQHYGRASQLWYYLPGRPVVYCSSSLMGGRVVPWDFWPRANLRLHPPELLGRPALVVGSADPAWQAQLATAFARIEHVGRLEADHKQGRPAFLCYEFRGLGMEGTKTGDEQTE